MPLRTASLNAARRVIGWQMTETATVHRLSHVVDTTGGFIDTYTAVATYPCSFSAFPITPIERENTITVQNVAFWRFVFPHDADIRPTDRLVVGERSFEVVNAGGPSINTHVQVIAQELG